MKTRLCFLLVLLILLGGCAARLAPQRGETQDEPPLEEPSGKDRPTIPEDVAEGSEYLYDFQFSQRYDEKVSDAFSLTLPQDVTGGGQTLRLLETFQSETPPTRQQQLDGDGMTPHGYQRYWYESDEGQVCLATHDYAPDNVQYLCYLWSDYPGAATDRGVSVGSEERELLTAYEDDLYLLPEGAEEFFFGEEEEERLFDYAYAWQPENQDNDIRDLTFYMRDGRVCAIEAASPFEMRYVYGCDRDAARRAAEEKRQQLQ